MPERTRLKRLLFSVTLDDCEVQTFRAGGPGGQNQNKVESAARIIHRPSGAIGESRELRDQLKNKKRAFARMAATDEFTRWSRLEAARRSGQKTPEQLTDEAMKKTDDFKLEVRDKNGKWVVVPMTIELVE